MLELPIISGYATAGLTIFQALLMLTVGNHRRVNSISIGDGGDIALQYLIRRHLNLVENLPAFLILLILVEMLGGTKTAVLGFALLFGAARLSHAYALTGPDKPLAPRVFGAAGTLFSVFGLAGTLIWTLSQI